MPRQMVAIPSVEGGSDVHSHIYEGGVERQCEWQKARRNIAQRKGESQRIKRSRCESGQHQRRDEQTVIMDKREQAANQGETCRAQQKNAPGTKQAAKINSQRPHKHQGDVEGAADPGAIIEADPKMALQV